MKWTTSTPVRAVRLGGAWIRTDAVQGIERTVADKTRVHLAGGGTVDVTVGMDEVAKAVWGAPTKEEER